MFRKKLSLLLLTMTVFAGITFAQQKDAEKAWLFHSINNIGVLEGQAGSAFQVQTVNGAQYKSWFAGVGVGLDYYRYRTVPLFLDLRKEFGQRNKIFGYADMGVNFSWLTETQKNMYVVDDHFGNGFYNDFGLGYKVAIGKNNSFLISLGYSFKKVTETYPTFPYFTDFVPGPAPQNDRIQYSLNRLSLKMGFEF